VNSPSKHLFGVPVVVFGLSLLHRPLDALGELFEVAHAKQPGDEAVGLEALDILHRFTGPEERNRGVRFVDCGQCTATFRRPVEFRDDDAFDADSLLEPLGLLFGPLADCGIEHQ